MALQSTYVASSNTATNGIALGVAGQDIFVKGIIFGAPADAAVLTLYHVTNPVNGSTDNVAAKVTQPTAAAGKDWVRFADFGKSGLRLKDGGNVITDGSQVTVIWDDEEQDS